MSYTNVAKPTGTPYTNVNTGGHESFDDATVLFDSTINFFDGTNSAAYTNISKPTDSAAVLVQSQKGYTGSSPLTIAYPSAVTANNLLIVCASSNDNSDAITISDDKNNIWTRAINDFNFSGPGGSIYYATANGNNTPTVTITGTDIGGQVYEYSGANGILDGTSTSGHTANTNTPTGASLVTSVPDLIIAFAFQEAASKTFNACGGGFTLQKHNDTHIDGVADYENAQPGTYACVFNVTGGATVQWYVLQAAFRLSKFTNVIKPS